MILAGSDPQKLSKYRVRGTRRPGRGAPTPLLWLFAFVLCASMTSDGHTQPDCTADGDIEYVCGLRNVEDLIHIVGTDWVLTGQLQPRSSNAGGFYLIRVSDRSFAELAPSFVDPPDPLYARCPGAPDPASFAAHGLAIRHRSGKPHQVYAINHGGREAIEVFDLDVSGRPALRWRGCVILPEDIAANAVTPLPLGFAVTSFGVRGDPGGFERMARGELAGFVAEWSPGGGWSRRSGNQFSGANGIAASDDGRLLFVSGWGDGTLNVLTREPDSDVYIRRVIELGDFRPDNIRPARDGSLLVAGQSVDSRTVISCARSALPRCLLPYRVMRIDPASYRATTLVDRPATPNFGAASTAIAIGDELWLGTFRGDRIARIPRK